MSTKRRTHDNDADFITSGGVRLSDVPEFARSHIEWMDGVHGAATDGLPLESDVAVADILNSLPELHPKRPRGSKAMIDANGARCRLKHCRSGAWLISPFAGEHWAVWPNGHIGWVPKSLALPSVLRVSNRPDVQ
jgi:hypothetical protein